MRKLISYLLLPPSVSRFEREYLERMTRVGLWFFWAHLPVMAIVAWLAKTDVLRALLYSAVVLAGPTAAKLVARNPRHVTRVFGFTAMTLGALLVHFGQGPMQIEMHFYFFVLIALLAVFGDPLVIILAAVTVALHHLVLWILAPASVFNYEASVWAVVVHALFVVVESVAACFVARSFFDNVIGLERIVARRTDELANRTDQMMLVLHNVDEGLVIVNADGRVGVEESAMLAKLLGQGKPGEHLWERVGRCDRDAGDWLEVGWSMLVEGVLPIEVATAQLPARFVSRGRVLALSYRPLPTRGDFAGLLFVVSDVTSEAERERYEAEQREMLVLFERVLQDRAGVVEFAAEASEILERVTDDGVSLPVAKRLLHTLKGNAGIFGCGRLARLCHEIEARVDECGGILPADAFELRTRWDHLRETLARFVGDEHQRFEIDPSDHAAVLRTLREGGSRSRVVAMLEDWTLEPTELRLRRLADQARALAARLGKGEIDVMITSNGLRLHPEQLRRFWGALLHVLRNAIDHGLESPVDRAAEGKPSRGRIGLATELTDAGLIVKVVDDGRGIAWDKVRLRAEAAGLPTATHDDLMAALFTDGLSTRESATEISGRGVGMSAIATECHELGGSIDVASETGRGTTVAITLPRRIAERRSVVTFPSIQDDLRVSA